MTEKGGDPDTLAEEEGLLQKSDGAYIETLADAVLEAHPQAAEEYKGGKENALMFLVGQGMKESKGAANPELLKEILKEKLKQ